MHIIMTVVFALVKLGRRDNFPERTLRSCDTAMQRHKGCKFLIAQLKRLLKLIETMEQTGHEYYYASCTKVPLKYDQPRSVFPAQCEERWPKREELLIFSLKLGY